MEATNAREKPHGQSRIITVVHEIDDLVGAHVHSLASFFARGESADPEDLGETPRGVLLAFAGTEAVHLALRPLVRATSRVTRSVWAGVAFDHGGNAGKNRIFGKEALRFHAERGPSLLDGKDALILTYEKAAWPFSTVRDELRTIGPGIAMGPTFRGKKLVAWFGYAR